MVILMGPESGKAGDGLPDGQVIHRNARLGDQIIQSGGGCVGAVPVLDVDGRRADDDIAVDGGAYQNALAQFAGQLEHRMAHESAGLLVQQAVIAPAGGNMQLPLLGHHIVQHVRVHARGVDHIPGLEVAAVRMNGPAAAASGEARYLCIEPEFHAVGISVLRQGNGHVKGADNTAGGGPQGGHGVFADVWLQFVKTFTVYNFQPLHTVLHTVFIEGLKSRHILLGHTDHQRAVHLERKIQIFGKLGNHPVAPDVHFGHEAAVGSVKARVDNGAVGLGGAAAHILCPLQNQHFPLIAGQIPGYRAAGDTRADNNYIVQMERLLQQKSGSPRKPSGRRGWAARHLH